MFLSPKARFAIVAVAAACSLSGCVFGNREIDPPGPGAIQGYYESQIQQITLYATTLSSSGSAGTTTFTNISSTAIPENSIAYQMINEAISDPVFLSYDSSSGLFSLQPLNIPSPQFTWPLESDDSGDLETPGPQGYSAPLMPNTYPNCELLITAQASGTYSSSGPFNTGTTLPLSGRIGLTADIAFTTNNNDCQELEACYNSSSACDAADNADVQAELSPFINAKLITATQIPDLTGLEYVITYQ